MDINQFKICEKTLYSVLISKQLFLWNVLGKVFHKFKLDKIQNSTGITTDILKWKILVAVLMVLQWLTQSSKTRKTHLPDCYWRKAERSLNKPILLYLLWTLFYDLGWVVRLFWNTFKLKLRALDLIGVHWRESSPAWSQVIVS